MDSRLVDWRRCIVYREKAGPGYDRTLALVRMLTAGDLSGQNQNCRTCLDFFVIMYGRFGLSAFVSLVLGGCRLELVLQLAAACI